VAILIVFPIAVFVGVFYLLAMIGDALEIRGGLGIVYFFGCLVVLLVLFVLASRHVRPVAMRLLDEVRLPTEAAALLKRKKRNAAETHERILKWICRTKC
jgi:hypothetical protein